MECPLKNGDCTKANCAWWDVDIECCAVKSIQDSLYYINKSMQDAAGDVKVSSD